MEYWDHPYPFGQSLEQDASEECDNRPSGEFGFPCEVGVIVGEAQVWKFGHEPT